MSLSGRKRDRNEGEHDNADGGTSGPNNDCDEETNREIVGPTISLDRAQQREHQQDQVRQPQANQSDTTIDSVADTSTSLEARNAVTSAFQSQPMYTSSDIQDGSLSSTYSGQQTSQIILHQLLNQMTSASANLATQSQLAAPAEAALQTQLQHGHLGTQLEQTPFPSLVSQHVPVITQSPIARLESTQSIPQQEQQGAAHNALSSVLLQAVIAMFPHLAQLPPGLQIQLLPLVQQYLLDQQRRQQEQLQLAIVISLLRQQQEQQRQQWHTQDNSSMQSGALQQILSTLAAGSATILPSNNPVTAMMQLLSMTTFGAGAAAQMPLLPSATTATTVPATSDPTTLMQVLATASNYMLQNTTAGQEANTAAAHGVAEISSGAAGSTDLPNVSRPSEVVSVGRPSDAFANRHPQGRALDLPTLLVMPSDLVELSSHQTLLRYQIEVFRASEEDVATHTRGRNKKVERGQIGIRCRHCKVLPVSERLRGSIYFPSTIEGFYQAAQNMNSTHLQTGECQMMGELLRQEFVNLVSSRGSSSSGAGRSYWVQQARNLGLENTKDGIRFHNDPPIESNSAGEDNQEANSGNKRTSSETT
jgi:hypothetical protein